MGNAYPLGQCLSIMHPAVTPQIQRSQSVHAADYLRHQKVRLRTLSSCRGRNTQKAILPLVLFPKSEGQLTSGRLPLCRTLSKSFAPEIAWEAEAARRETLILEAEMMLAWQTPLTYRRWFSYWRCRGIGVNDLLDMTWIWCRRARI